MNKVIAFSICFFCFFSEKSFAQDSPLPQSFIQDTTLKVVERGGCIEVNSAAQFVAGDYDGNRGTASVCFIFPSTCGAEIYMNSNTVVDFIYFIREDGKISGTLGVGSYNYPDIQELSAGDVQTLPFDFGDVKVYKGAVKVHVTGDIIQVEKLESHVVGDMFITVDLPNFTATLVSNTTNFTNWSIEAKPAHVCYDYQAVQYAVACPLKNLRLVSRCFDLDGWTVWTAPDGSIVGNTDTLILPPPAQAGMYEWETPCNKGYWIVYPVDSVYITATPIFCSNKQRLSLLPGLKGLWSSGVHGKTATVSNAGWYSVLVDDCAVGSIYVDGSYNSLDSMQVHFIPDVDTLLFNQEPVQVVSNISGTSFVWNKNGNVVPEFSGPGFYSVTGEYDECKDVDTILVLKHLFEQCDWPTFGPNAFSPNYDGNNDVFNVFGPEGSDSFIEVYDRWGELVFRSSSPNEGWDGTCRGHEMNPAVFVWRARIVKGFQECRSPVGSVTLLR